MSVMVGFGIGRPHSEDVLKVNAKFPNGLSANAQPFPGLLQGFALNVPWAEVMRGHIHSERHAIWAVAIKHPGKRKPEPLRQLSNSVCARQLRLKIIDGIVMVKRLAHFVAFKRQPRASSSCRPVISIFIPSKPELLADVALPMFVCLQVANAANVRLVNVRFLGCRSRSGV